MLNFHSLSEMVPRPWCRTRFYGPVQHVPAEMCTQLFMHHACVLTVQSKRVHRE